MKPACNRTLILPFLSEMNHIRSSPLPVNSRFPILSAQESGMILRDHKHLLKLNQMAVEIHTTHSWDDLVSLVAKSLPLTLDAEEATWSEHGPVVPMDHIGPNMSAQDAIIALILARISSGQSHPSANASQQVENCGANLGVYDVAALISSSLRMGVSDFPGIGQQILTCHQIVTQFFVDAHRGILLTVQNSRPFTAEQKFTLSLLREHFAIAARRHYRRDSNSRGTHHRSQSRDLSRREMEILPFLAKGATNMEIANSLGISMRTVEKHVASILDKAELEDRRMLVGLSSLSTMAKPADR